MLALLDGDIFTYRIGHTTNNDSLDIALYRYDTTVDEVLHDTGATSYQLFLSDSLENNFRFQLYPEYKANRAAQPKPTWYNELKEHAITQWGAKIAYGQEADDALGQWQGENSIICSIDKDLLQIVGEHYNFVKKEFYSVCEKEGLVNFYWQLVLGDRTDNIGGFDGIRRSSEPKFLLPVRGYLEQCINEYQMFSLVQHLYENDDQLLLNGRLLKIRTKEDEIWEIPKVFRTFSQTAV